MKKKRNHPVSRLDEASDLNPKLTGFPSAPEPPVFPCRQKDEMTRNVTVIDKN